MSISLSNSSNEVNLFFSMLFYSSCMKVEVLDLKGNLFTDATFADAAPLTPRTPSTIKVLLPRACLRSMRANDSVSKCSFDKRAILFESLVSDALILFYYFHRCPCIRPSLSAAKWTKLPIER